MSGGAASEADPKPRVDADGAPLAREPIPPAEAQPDRQRQDEVRDNLARLRDLLSSGPWEADAAVLRMRRNVAWLSAGADTHVDASSPDSVAILLVTHDDAIVLTTVIEAPRLLEEEFGGVGLEVIGLPWEQPDALRREIERRAGPHAVGDAALEPALAWVRAELNDGEQDRLRRLALETSQAVTDTFAELAPGGTERAAAARLAMHLEERGIAAPVLLAAADDRFSRFRHPIPTPAPIGECLMLVAVGERDGLHAAVSRLGWLRGRPSVDRRERYAAAARIHRALVRGSIPGTSLASALAGGIGAYAREGVPDEWRHHHQGGVIGYQPREVIATPTVSGDLRANMAMAWNPSVSDVKVEETVLVTTTGELETLTLDPRWPLLEDVADIGVLGD